MFFIYNFFPWDYLVHCVTLTEHGRDIEVDICHDMCSVGPKGDW